MFKRLLDAARRFVLAFGVFSPPPHPETRLLCALLRADVRPIWFKALSPDDEYDVRRPGWLFGTRIPSVGATVFYIPDERAKELVAKLEALKPGATDAAVAILKRADPTWEDVA